MQLNNLAVEQDIFNLKRECEEKDAVIKELTTFVQSSNMASSNVMFPLCSPYLLTILGPSVTLTVNFFLITEDIRVGGHYTHEEHNNYKIKEGHGGSRTKGE